MSGAASAQGALPAQQRVRTTDEGDILTRHNLPTGINEDGSHSFSCVGDDGRNARPLIAWNVCLSPLLHGDHHPHEILASAGEVVSVSDSPAGFAVGNPLECAVLDKRSQTSREDVGSDRQSVAELDERLSSQECLSHDPEAPGVAENCKAPDDGAWIVLGTCEGR